jgi:hypothetical protein
MAFYWNRFFFRMNDLDGNFSAFNFPSFSIINVHFYACYRHLNDCLPFYLFLHAQLTSELFFHLFSLFNLFEILCVFWWFLFDLSNIYMTEKKQGRRRKNEDNCEHFEEHRFWYFLYVKWQRDETIFFFSFHLSTTYNLFGRFFYEQHFLFLFYICVENHFKLNLISIWMMGMSTSDIKCSKINI